MLDQLPRISLSTCGGLTAKVNEVIRVVVSLTHHIMLGIVQKRQELLEEALLAFDRELVVESPESAAEDGPETVDVGSRRKPVSWLVSSHGYDSWLHETYQRATAS